MKDINEAFEVLGTLETRRLYHPEWLRKRRESNNRQAPPRTATSRGTYERPETYERSEPPIHSTSSKRRIPVRGKWVVGLSIIFFGGLLLILLPTFLLSNISNPIPSPAPLQLSNGTYLVRNLVGGCGELKIDNGLDLDAVALLSRFEEPAIPLMAVYIRAGASHTIRGVSDGVYLLYFKTGED